MAVISKLHFALVIFALGLQGCARTSTSASIQIRKDYVSDATMAELVEKIQTKAISIGAKCKFLEKSRGSISCRTTSENPNIVISAGTNARDEFIIAVESVRTHVIPPSERSVNSGEFVTERLLDIEAWMIELVPQDQIVAVNRSYTL